MSSTDGTTVEDVPDIVAQRQGGNTENSRWRDECEDILDALANADGPLTVGELAVVTFLGAGAVTNRLNDLRERGRVERVRDPEDRRVVRYARVGDVEDGGR